MIGRELLPGPKSGGSWLPTFSTTLADRSAWRWTCVQQVQSPRRALLSILTREGKGPGPDRSRGRCAEVKIQSWSLPAAGSRRTRQSGLIDQGALDHPRNPIPLHTSIESCEPMRTSPVAVAWAPLDRTRTFYHVLGHVCCFPNRHPHGNPHGLTPRHAGFEWERSTH